MSKIRKNVREKLAARLLDGLLARLDSPKSLTIPDESMESLDIDDDWSLLKDLTPEFFEGASTSASTERLRASVSGTKPITIRVPNRVLQAYRSKACKTGIAYQTLINRALKEAADELG